MLAGIHADLAHQMAELGALQDRLPALRRRLESLDAELGALGPRPSGEANIRRMDLDEARRRLRAEMADIESRRAEGEFVVRAASYMDGGTPSPQAPLAPLSGEGPSAVVATVAAVEAEADGGGGGGHLKRERDEGEALPPAADEGEGAVLPPFAKVRRVCRAGTQWADYNLKVHGKQVKRAARPKAGEKRMRLRAAKQVASLVQENLCFACKASEMVLSGGDLLCTACNARHPYIAVDDKHLKSQCVFQNTGSRFSYKKPNHFKDWMLRVQAKETKKIPQALLDRVIHECTAFNVQSAADVDRRKVLRILKRIKQTKWNDHATKITFLINGVRPVQFTDAQQSILVNMFNDLLPTWHKHVDKKRRSNFCSYGYTLYKLCQMKGWNEFLPYFPLLRGKVKLAQTDAIWRAMMADLGWPFHPSI